MNKNTVTIIIVVIILMISVTIGFYYFSPKEDIVALPNPIPTEPNIKTPPSAPVACPEDAKVCPDGTSVGRTGANCEFTECPEIKEEIDENTDRNTLNIDKVNKNIEKWESYENNVANFSIKYPKEWGPVGAEVFRKAISGKGEEFYTLFTNSKLSISGITSDFMPWEVWGPTYKGTNEPISYCKEIQEKVVTLESCKEIEKNKAVITFGYYSDMGGLNFTRNVFIRNSENKYGGITISYNFDSNDYGLGNMNDKQRKLEIESQLGKINQNLIEIFDAVIFSFKYTDK